MATAETMKANFATGKKPSGANFAELIDAVDSKTKASDLTGLAKTSDLTAYAKKTEAPTKAQYDALVKRVEALEVPAP